MNWHRVFFEITLGRLTPSEFSIICHISIKDDVAICIGQQHMPYLLDGEKWRVTKRVPLTIEEEQQLYQLHPEARQFA